jgi:predicted aspartyl protease
MLYFMVRAARRNAVLTGLALLLAVSIAPARGAIPVENVPSAAKVEAMLASPRVDIFALEAALPHIRDASLALLVRARMAAARLHAPAARRLLDPLLANSGQPPHRRVLAWQIATDAAFAAGDYAQAAKAAQSLQAALAAADGDRTERDDAALVQAMAAQLATLPAQRVESYRPQSVPVHLDKVGLTRSMADINGLSQEVVLDTGANLSVVSLSTARRLGLHLQEGGARVGSVGGVTVATRLGTADVLRFAGLTLHDVDFLVLDDDQLAMPVAGGYRIDAILGFPVLRQLQRFRITATGRFEPGVAGAAGAAEENLRMIGNDLIVHATVGDWPVAMHIDSGAVHSSLSGGFARRHAKLLENLESRRQRMAGAGAAVTRDTRAWPHVRVRVAGRETVLDELSVMMPGTGGDASPLSVLGGDVLHAFAWWAIDFERMRLDLGPATATDAPAPMIGAGFRDQGLNASNVPWALSCASTALGSPTTTMLCCFGSKYLRPIACTCAAVTLLLSAT